MEKLQQRVVSLESEAGLLHTQLHAANQETLGHTQEVSELQRRLQDAHRKMEEMEAGLRKLIKEKEELRQALEEQEEQARITLQEETHRLRVQNQDLQQQVCYSTPRGVRLTVGAFKLIG